MKYLEIRNTTKRLLREGAPSLQQYEEALPLCKEDSVIHIIPPFIKA